MSLGTMYQSTYGTSSKARWSLFAGAHIIAFIGDCLQSTNGVSKPKDCQSSWVGGQCLCTRRMQQETRWIPYALSCKEFTSYQIMKKIFKKFAIA